MSVARRNLVLATLALSLCFLAWGLIAPLARRFQIELQLTSAQTALLVATPVVLGALLRIPAGALSDRFGGRRTFAAVIAASALPAALVGFVHSYDGLLLVALLLGLAGSSFAVGVPFVSRWFRRERHGLALGLYALGGAGTACAAFAAPAIVSSWGIRALGLAVATLLLLGALLFWRLADDPPQPRREARYREVVRSGWRLYRLACFYFVAFGAIVALSVFLPKLLGDWFGYSLAQAGLRTAGFTLAALVARAFGGLLADRISPYAILSVAFAGIVVDAIALVELSDAPTIAPVTLVFLSLAACLGAGAGAVFKLLPAEFPEHAGAATGIVAAAGGLGGFFPPLLLGYAEDRAGSYAAAFAGLLVVGVCCFGAAACLAWSRRSA